VAVYNVRILYIRRVYTSQIDLIITEIATFREPAKGNRQYFTPRSAYNVDDNNMVVWYLFVDTVVCILLHIII